MHAFVGTYRMHCQSSLSLTHTRINAHPHSSRSHSRQRNSSSSVDFSIATAPFSVTASRLYLSVRALLPHHRRLQLARPLGLRPLQLAHEVPLGLGRVDALAGLVQG